MDLSQGFYRLHRIRNYNSSVSNDKATIIQEFIVTSCICFPGVTLVYQPRSDCFGRSEQANSENIGNDAIS